MALSLPMTLSSVWFAGIFPADARLKWKSTIIDRPQMPPLFDGDMIISKLESIQSEDFLLRMEADRFLPMISDVLATSLEPLPSTLGAKAFEAHNISA